jgi:hypothetical protein
MTHEQKTELRTIARDTYIKTRINRPHMPDPDTDDGQRRIDRLFDIMAGAMREGRLNIDTAKQSYGQQGEG